MNTITENITPKRLAGEIYNGLGSFVRLPGMALNEVVFEVLTTGGDIHNRHDWIIRTKVIANLDRSINIDANTNSGTFAYASNVPPRKAKSFFVKLNGVVCSSYLRDIVHGSDKWRHEDSPNTPTVDTYKSGSTEAKRKGWQDIAFAIATRVELELPHLFREGQVRNTRFRLDRLVKDQEKAQRVAKALASQVAQARAAQTLAKGARIKEGYGMLGESIEEGILRIFGPYARVGCQDFCTPNHYNEGESVIGKFTKLPGRVYDVITDIPTETHDA